MRRSRRRAADSRSADVEPKGAERGYSRPLWAVRGFPAQSVWRMLTASETAGEERKAAACRPGAAQRHNHAMLICIYITSLKVQSFR